MILDFGYYMFFWGLNSKIANQGKKDSISKNVKKDDQNRLSDKFIMTLSKWTTLLKADRKWLSQ